MNGPPMPDLSADEWRVLVAHRRLTPHVLLIVWRLMQEARRT